jgi:hypothetical protein
MDDEFQPYLGPSAPGTTSLRAAQEWCKGFMAATVLRKKWWWAGDLQDIDTSQDAAFAFALLNMCAFPPDNTGDKKFRHLEEQFADPHHAVIKVVMILHDYLHADDNDFDGDDTVNNSGAGLDKQEIVAQLEYFTGAFPRAALAAAIANPQEMVPELLRFITYAREHAEDIRNDKLREYMGHIYALYLLAQFREHSAYAPIVDLFGSVPDEIIHDITGDVITEDLHRILPSICHGDDTLIKALVENEQAGPYVRAAALASLVTMVVNGIKSRDEVIAYFAKLFQGGIRRQPSMVWNELVGSSIDLNPKELYGEILRAREEGLFETGFVSLAELEEERCRSVEQSLESLCRNPRFSLIDDAIGAMSWWACFNEHDEVAGATDDSDDLEEPAVLPGDGLFGPALPPPVRTGPKIGRNDACPCGSGKKYKKCCGKN